jgi:hypothetical protein
MDEKRKRFKARMDELNLKNSQIDKRAGLPDGATRDYLGRTDRPGNEPSIERAMRFADAVGWTLEQFYKKVDRIRIRFSVDGVLRGAGMWSAFTNEQPETIILDVPTDGLVTIKVSPGAEVPESGLRAGDTIIASRHDGPNFGNLVRLDCIIKTRDGQELFGILHPGSQRGKYNVQPLNPRLEPVTDVQIEWAAPITMILKARNF